MKAKFICELNALNIDTFVMDDKANAGMRKLFFSDSQEVLRHISLVGEYDECVNDSSPAAAGDESSGLNAIASGVPPAGAAGGVPLAIANDKAYKTLSTIKSVESLMTNRKTRRSNIRLKEIIT